MKKYILRIAALSLAAMMLLTSSGLALTLRYPQRGDDVASLQNALRQLGYYTKTIDGIYGSGTLSAVKAFQKANGLSADGVAGPKTLSKIEKLTGVQIGGSSSDDSSTGTDTPTIMEGLFSGNYSTIEYGAKGDRVRILQRALDALGYTVGKIDGSFGSGTLAAVKQFQKAHSLTVDGKAGKKTLKELESYFDEAGNLINGPIVIVPPAADEEEENGYGVPTRTLRQGMSGLDVQYTQQRLYELGYYSGKRDGNFDSAMFTAVKAFQRKHDLDVDGVIGAQTRKILFSSDALRADEEEEEDTDGFRTLTFGMVGTDVAAVQLRLKDLGYYTGTADGLYGVETMSAMMIFQARNSLTANGECNETTYAKLFSDDAIRAEIVPDVDEPEEDESTPTPAPMEIPTRTLRYGYSGDDVKLLQTRLIELGYLTGTANGTFGTTTLTAVKAFQKNNGLTVDGVAGTQTYKKLFSDSAVEADQTTNGGNVLIPDRSLSSGDTGDDVKSVQQRLKVLGFYTGTVDGSYGSSTTSAMKAFQQMNSLTATGNGNMATYAKMYSDDAINSKGVKVGEAVPSYTNLKSGATGTAVIRLQQALASYNYDVSVTGTYDDATLQAVRSFQAINGLSVDGIAGRNTQTVLYSGDCKKYPTGPDDAIYGSLGYVAAPAKSKIKLLHWTDDIKNNVAYGDVLLAFDPETGISWSLTIIARGRHCDVEPTAKADTAAMHAAFGNIVTWTPKPVYIRLPDGTWTVATTHNVAHGINPIPDNDFEGQNCVHFLRDMSETEKNDPDYGVTNQKALRDFWYRLTGETIAYK